MYAEIWYTDDLSSHFGMRGGVAPPMERLGQYNKVRTRVSVTAEGLDACEELFARFNRGSGREDSALDGIRSMSCGDIVKLYDDNDSVIAAWFCASSGWVPIEQWPVKQEASA